MVDRGGKLGDYSNTWLFSEEAFLCKCPSRQLMTVSQDLKTRELIFAFLMRLGTDLKLDGRTILTATIFIHRFFMRMPITTSKYFVACAAVAISCKLNDAYRAPDKVALTACIIKNPNKQIDQHSSLFWQWRDQLLYREELILKLLNFELNVELPYDYIDDILLHRDEGLQNPFELRLPEILKHTISKIELISALPILVAFDMRVLFAVMLILTVKEARSRFGDCEDMTVPRRFLEDNLDCTVADAHECYQYIKKLMSICRDPKLPSHKNVLKNIPVISEEDFYTIIGDSSHSKNGLEQPKGLGETN